MRPDAVLALPTAKPALMGPDAAINAIHANRIAELTDEEERRTFIATEEAKYEAGIDVFKIANENAIEAVVPPAQLRTELARRFAIYSRRKPVPCARRNGVYPV